MYVTASLCARKRETDKARVGVIYLAAEYGFVGEKCEGVFVCLRKTNISINNAAICERAPERPPSPSFGPLCVSRPTIAASIAPARLCDMHVRNYAAAMASVSCTSICRGVRWCALAEIKSASVNCGNVIDLDKNSISNDPLGDILAFQTVIFSSRLRRSLLLCKNKLPSITFPCGNDPG